MSKIIILILAILVVSTVITAAGAAQKAQELVVLENQANTLEEQNKELQTQIISSNSLSHIQEEANKMGMVSPEKFAYMGNSGIALR